MKTPRAPVPSEDYEQMALIDWCNLLARRFPDLSLLYAIPNAGNRHINFAVKQKKMGLQAGVPDLHLPIARHGYHSLYIEMKRIRGGQLSPDQKAWVKVLRYEGHRVEITKGWGEASAVIIDYLALPIMTTDKRQTRKEK